MIGLILVMIATAVLAVVFLLVNAKVIWHVCARVSRIYEPIPVPLDWIHIRHQIEISEGYMRDSITPEEERLRRATREGLNFMFEKIHPYIKVWDSEPSPTARIKTINFSLRIIPSSPSEQVQRMKYDPNEIPSAVVKKPRR